MTSQNNNLIPLILIILIIFLIITVILFIFLYRKQLKNIEKLEIERNEFLSKITELQYQHKIDLLDVEKKFISNNNLKNAVETVNEVTQKLSSIDLSFINNISSNEIFEHNHLEEKKNYPKKIDKSLMNEFQELTQEQNDNYTKHPNYTKVIDKEG